MARRPTFRLRRSIDSDEKLRKHSGGNAISLGPVALLEQRGVRVIVAPRKMQASAPGLLLHLGLEPESPPIIVVKSSAHFRGAYQAMAREIILASAPGLVESDLSKLSTGLPCAAPPGAAGEAIRRRGASTGDVAYAVSGASALACHTGGLRARRGFGRFGVKASHARPRLREQGQKSRSTPSR